MNVKGRELFGKFEKWNRLISFYDSITGNDAYQIINLKRDTKQKGLNKEK